MVGNTAGIINRMFTGIIKELSVTKMGKSNEICQSQTLSWWWIWMVALLLLTH